ncbi:NAD-dependent epimerase/dehydratase family protein [Parasphingorhabdus pacifica]
MSLRVFVVGATGVVGRTLLPQLSARGHHVTALVRREGQEADLAGVDEVATADLLELEPLRLVLKQAAPDVVIHQASAWRGSDVESAMRATARLRDVGTRNLVTASVDAGVPRMIAQSTVAAYCPNGHDVLDEEAPLWTDAPGVWGEAVRAVASLEETVLTNPGIEGVALRYGALYGPGTWYAPGGLIHEQVRGSALPLVEDHVGLTSFTHVDDAASSVLEVLTGGDPGAFNVVDNEPAECAEWLPAYARMVGGPAPVSLTLEQAKAQLDWLTVHQLTEQRAATNFRLRETMGWRPGWPSWREGFATMFGLWPG